jgi:hypothetical protein
MPANGENKMKNIHSYVPSSGMNVITEVDRGELFAAGGLIEQVYWTNPMLMGLQASNEGVSIGYRPLTLGIEKEEKFGPINSNCILFEVPLDENIKMSMIQ